MVSWRACGLGEEGGCYTASVFVLWDMSPESPDFQFFLKVIWKSNYLVQRTSGPRLLRRRDLDREIGSPRIKKKKGFSWVLKGREFCGL